MMAKLKKHAVALHSGLFILGLLACALYLALQPSDGFYEEPPVWLDMLLIFLCFGGPEAIALWLFERRKMLRPATQFAGALLLWLCFPLAIGLIYVTFGPTIEISADYEDTLANWLFVYCLLGSHCLWFVLVSLVQISGNALARHKQGSLHS